MSSTLVSRPAATAPAALAGASPAAAAATAAADAALPLADWIERVVRGLDRGGRHWTQARRKEALQRVLAANRRDGERLQQRLGSLLAQWEQDTPDRTPAELDQAAGGTPAAAPAAAAPAVLPAEGPARQEAAAGPLARDREAAAPSVHPPPAGPDAAERDAWQALLARVGSSLQRALPAQDAAAEALAAELEAGTRALREAPPDAARAAALAGACDRADRLLAHHRVLVERLGGLCDELVGSLGALAEDARWAEGPADAVRARLADGLSARGLHAVTELLRRTRERQQQLRRQRDEARDALKAFLPRMLAELAALGEASGRFHGEVARHADRIARADTLESVAGAVQELVGEARDIEAVFGQAQRRLRDEHARASALDERVGRLEGELRRLSDEVATDPLTQLANRRGLFAAFDVERARIARGGEPLAIALLDVDNFKRLNDDLGHSAGDAALKHLAARVAQGLRPTDHVARYGGEEFVLLLPATAVDDALRLLSRLQRGLSESLFLHEQRQVFVTFSAGVTAYRPDEALEVALERADQALYEAKHGGKNRSCAV